MDSFIFCLVALCTYKSYCFLNINFVTPSSDFSYGLVSQFILFAFISIKRIFKKWYICLFHSNFYIVMFFSLTGFNRSYEWRWRWPPLYFSWHQWKCFSWISFSVTLAFELRWKRFAVLTEYPRIPGVFLFNTENERWMGRAPAQLPPRWAPGFRFRARRAGRRVHTVVHAVACARRSGAPALGGAVPRAHRAARVSTPVFPVKRLRKTDPWFYLYSIFFFFFFAYDINVILLIS